MDYKELFNAANLISFARIPLAVLMVVFYENTFLFFALLALAILSDALDGYVARRTGSTRLGAVIDPLCDKVFVIILLLFFLFTGRLGVVQLLLVSSRDILVALLLAVLYFHPKKEHLKKELKARWPGKITTDLQFVSLVWLVLGIPYFVFLPYIVFVSSLVSIADYLLMVKRVLKR
jgi:cardiolipin synthase